MKSLIASSFVLGLAWPLAAAELPVKNGDKIGFLGDSITVQGAAPSGYVSRVISGLKVLGVEAEAIPAGQSGTPSGSMRSRVGPQVLDKGATWLSLSCGVNDVRLTNEGRSGGVEEFKKNVTDIVERAQAKNVKVILLTTTPLGEDLDGERNKQVEPYNTFLRAYAKEENLILADVNTAFREALAKPPAAGETPGKRLLADGTHPNPEGQTIMARTILKALGVTDEDFPKIEKEWLDNPTGKGVKVGKGSLALISEKQFDALEKSGKARPIVTQLWRKALEESGEPADSEKAKTYAQEKIGPMVDEYLKTNPPKS